MLVYGSDVCFCVGDTYSNLEFMPRASMHTTVLCSVHAMHPSVDSRFYSSLQLKTMVRTRSEHLRTVRHPQARTRAEFLHLYRELDRCLERIADLTRLISEINEMDHLWSWRLAQREEYSKEKKRLLLYEDDLHVKIWEFLGFSDNVARFRFLANNVRQQLRNLITYDLATADEVASFEDMLFRVVIDESDDEVQSDHDSDYDTEDF